MANYVSESTGGDFDENKKRVITPKMMYETIESGIKGAFYGGFAVSFAFLLLAVMFYFIFSQMLVEKWLLLMKFVLFSIPIIIAIANCVTYMYRIKELRTGEAYDIITDTAVNVVTDDKTVYRHRGTRGYMSTEHAMYLYVCGRQVITLQETYLYSEKDRFYVLVHKKRPTKALLYFCEKLYDLEA